MRNAVARVAHILGLAVRYVHMDAEQHVLEAFRRVVHEAQLEALLVEEAFGQGAPQRVWRQCGLIRELQLRKQFLQNQRNQNYVDMFLEYDG